MQPITDMGGQVNTFVGISPSWRTDETIFSRKMQQQKMTSEQEAALSSIPPRTDTILLLTPESCVSHVMFL